MTYFLGIDIGTSATKALICDAQGRVRATAEAAHADPTGDRPGHSEQNPRDWWRAVGEAVPAALARAGVRGDAIVGVGLSGQMHGGVFLDDSETPLRPAIIWNDQRTADQCARIEQLAGGQEALIDMVGNPALAGFTAPKILWLREHEPSAYEKTRHILLPKDYIRLRMTGEYATEVGDASGTLLLDVKKRAWNQRMLDLLEIDRALLPRCDESHAISGRVTREAAQTLGLKAGTPVVGGSGDQPAGAIGNGIVRGGIASATLGTSGVVFAHAEQPMHDTRGRVHTMCSAVAGKWCVFGCMLSAGGSLQWFRNQLAQHEIEQAKQQGVDPYDLLMDEAQKAPPGSDGLFFLPYLTGERCPHPDPFARGGWVGLAVRHDRPAMIRALIEGVTFGMTDILRIMEQMTIDVRTVRLSGGGARSAFWRQLQADVYNKPVATINAGEGPAYGVAILAGVGTGHWQNAPEACDAIIEETEQRQPDANRAARYARHHVQYQRLYPALRREMHHIAQLADAGAEESSDN